MDTKNVARPLATVKRNKTSRGFARTDAGNAELFSALYKDHLRYHHGRGSWFVWQEQWFAEDHKQAVMQLAKRAVRLRYRQAPRVSDLDARKREAEWALRSEARPRLEALLALAQSERSLAAAEEEWDSDPWLLGVGNGVVSLQTGRLRVGKPSDLISLHTAVPFDPSAQCPRWQQFLEEIFSADRELIDYVQRAVGYCLTGLTTEQVLFLCQGFGANGKSTFLDVLQYVLGSYACTLPFSAFELKARSMIPNDIAALPGKRFVTALETSESVELNEARIKHLTGCDPVSARLLYHEFFTFRPVGKFWLAFNHKPQVVDDSPGFWRRVRLIPFPKQFGNDTADKELVRKLKAEAPGILLWAVEGCLRWQREGLGLPRAVVHATEIYREENDEVAGFLADRCIISQSATVTAAALWEDYCYWTDGVAEQRLSRRAFAARLETRGFRKQRMGHDRAWFWVGLCLNPSGSPVPSQLALPPSPAVLTGGVRTDADVKSLLLGKSGAT